MGEGFPKFEPKNDEPEIELLPADPEADDAAARERGAADIESGAARMEAEIAELTAKGELNEEEKARLARLQETRDEWLRDARGMREAK